MPSPPGETTLHVIFSAEDIVMLPIVRGLEGYSKSSVVSWSFTMLSHSISTREDVRIFWVLLKFVTVSPTAQTKSRMTILDSQSE
jgi:hypothetical protein